MAKSTSEKLSQIQRILAALVEVEGQRFQIENVLVESLQRITERLDAIERRLADTHYKAEIDEEQPAPKPPEKVN